MNDKHVKSQPTNIKHHIRDVLYTVPNQIVKKMRVLFDERTLCCQNDAIFSNPFKTVVIVEINYSSCT